MSTQHTEDRSQSDEQLTLAMGCFWSPEALFGQFTGVIQTATGYAGGTTSHPTYRDLGDHSESIEMTFYPQAISLEQLLCCFWENHRPDAINGYKGRQYMSILFYRNQQQYEVMLRVQQQYAPESLSTEIVPYTDFTEAEERHQKYYLQRKSELFKSWVDHLGNYENLFHSTIGARLNALSKGHMTWADIIKEWENKELQHVAKRQRHNILEWIQQSSTND